MTRATVESAVAAGAGMVDATSIDDVVALQYEFAKGCVERFIVAGARLSELGLKTASDLYGPVGIRAEKTMEVSSGPRMA